MLKLLPWLLPGGLVTVSISLIIVIPAGPPRSSGPGDTVTVVSLTDCPTLKIGHSDPVAGKSCVRILQTTLRARGYTAQAVTGTFGKQTKRNVADFQHQHGMKPDGVVGPRTRSSLLTASVARPPKPKIKPSPTAPANPAPTPSPTVTATPPDPDVGLPTLTTCGSVFNGGPCQITGSGYLPGEVVTLGTSNDAGPGAGASYERTADDQGEFDCTVVWLSAPNETVTVTAVGRDSGRVANGTFTLTSS